MAARALVSRLQKQALPALRRPAGARALSWDALSRKVEGDAEAKADFNALKNQWDAIEKDFATYGAKAAPAIDWAHYSKQIEAPGFVEFLKQRYDSIEWGKAAASAALPESEVAADKAEKEALLRDGQAIVKAAEGLIAETKAKLEMAASKRTNRDSLVEDVWAKNPKIKEEVMAEIEDHQWFKDIK